MKDGERGRYLLVSVVLILLVKPLPVYFNIFFYIICIFTQISPSKFNVMNTKTIVFQCELTKNYNRQETITIGTFLEFIIWWNVVFLFRSRIWLDYLKRVLPSKQLYCTFNHVLMIMIYLKNIYNNEQFCVLILYVMFFSMCLKKRYNKVLILKQSQSRIQCQARSDRHSCVRHVFKEI